jgi:hypothetical protein
MTSVGFIGQVQLCRTLSLTSLDAQAAQLTNAVQVTNDAKFLQVQITLGHDIDGIKACADAYGADLKKDLDSGSTNGQKLAPGER